MVPFRKGVICDLIIHLIIHIRGEERESGVLPLKNESTTAKYQSSELETHATENLTPLDNTYRLKCHNTNVIL